ncbi:MAG TPA: Ppx/GppA phosphatase family protein [Pyrinomonadaceae bacterium]|nr:Ppx/GppA phosphatase family protein [Pyrinomonadaceae bacterium]
MKLASIDIGSNSIKLAVVDAAASDSLAIIGREKDVVRLGHETLSKGYLAPSAIERASETIKRFRSIAEARGAEKIIGVATASVREASNSAEFIKEIERQTGVRVEILSGIEEARLIGLAASQACAERGATSVNIDIGGGSTEISVFRNGIPLSLFSVKVGAVAMTEKFLHSDPPRSKEMANLKSEIKAAFERPARQLRGGKWQHVTGTSGTILALGAALRAEATTDAERKQQAAQPAEAEIAINQLSRLNGKLSDMSAKERDEIPGISSQRSEIIVAGGQILEGAMRALGINMVRTCDWALREGVIIDRLREWEAESLPPLPDLSDPKLRGVHAVGRRFGYEETHSHQVARLAEKIFDSLAATEKLTRHQRTLLSAAALLHDVGYHIASESHHKHSLYLIKNSELTGFSEAERAVIANIARYHRGSLPKERHPEFATLNPADRETVFRLGAIVRLADALDRSHEILVEDLRCFIEEDTINIQLRSAFDCENELREAERKSEMFEEAFDCTLNLSLRRLKTKRA